MDKIIEWFTRKKLMTISIVGTVCFLILIPKKVLFFACGAHSSPVCVDIFGYFLLSFLFGLTILIPMLVMSLLNSQVFEFWKKSLFIYLFIYLFIIVFVPWYTEGDFIHLQKDLIALGFSAVYFVFSIVLIIYKALKR